MAKRILRLRESQIKLLINNIISEQLSNTDNRNCIPINLMTKGNAGSFYIRKEDKNNIEHHFHDDGTYREWQGSKQIKSGTWKCGEKFIEVTDRNDSKLISYFPFPSVTPNNQKETINLANCAPQLVDTSKGKILKFGCKTQGVKELQTMLDMANPTGYFGSITKQKVIDFQKTHKGQDGNPLKVDGMVGPETYAALVQSVNVEPKDIPGSGANNNFAEL
jgi:peptidoglycan hydrolase-like protein with peptidoglycan-binding domain